MGDSSSFVGATWDKAQFLVLRGSIGGKAPSGDLEGRSRRHENQYMDAYITGPTKPLPLSMGCLGADLHISGSVEEGGFSAAPTDYKENQQLHSGVLLPDLKCNIVGVNSRKKGSCVAHNSAAAKTSKNHGEAER